MTSSASTARHRSIGRASTTARGGAQRSLLAGAAVLGAVVVLAVGGAGTFALWADATVANAGTVTSGTTGLTINGVENAVVTGMDASKLAPGTSVVTALTVANSGTTPLDVAVSQSAVSAQTKALAAELTVRLTPVASSAACVAGLAGASGRIAAFPTATISQVPAGASALYCLELALDADAPASTQGGAATFVLTFTGKQVAP